MAAVIITVACVIVVMILIVLLAALEVRKIGARSSHRTAAPGRGSVNKSPGMSDMKLAGV